mmetsp:Transcript_63959/g.169294  ORF Transcript_63959/g.169294 Transcript_63959/m.169294 type:complete len:436 (-) Transcript_63959:105-1412(-)
MAATSEVEDRKAEIKKQIFRGVCVQWFTAVVAHTMNLQSEAILMRNACGGDLGQTTRLVANCNALTGVLGLIVNQFGAKLSDSMGRKSFYVLGPLAQLLAGVLVYANPQSLSVLTTTRVLKGIFTTFSGTVMGGTGLKDVYEGKELGTVMTKAGSVIGLAIMLGPLLESIILKRVKTGGERLSFLSLGVLGAVATGCAVAMLPETLAPSQRKDFDVASAAAAANPFGFLQIFTRGSSATKKLAVITTLQTAIDGKNMSDLSMIWLREHLKFTVDGIRNFLISYGLLTVVASGKLVPALMDKLSVSEFTTLTNLTNFAAFTIRGSAESAKLFFSSLPLMLPGVNGASATALIPILNQHLVSSGFGTGESTAFLHNMRVMTGVLATLIYGYFYAWCRRAGVNPGFTYAVAGLLGGAIPQLLFALSVKDADLQTKKST